MDRINALCPNKEGRLSSRWRHQMETFSALLALCAGNSPVSGEFPTQKPVTQSFDVFSDFRLIKRLSNHSRSWWFETISRPLWRQCNVNMHVSVSMVSSIDPVVGCGDIFVAFLTTEFVKPPVVQIGALACQQSYSRFAPIQWETTLLCNDVFYWLGASLGSSLRMYIAFSFQVIKFIFTTFELEPDSNCSFDSLSIYDGSSSLDSNLLDKVCGSSMPGSIYTTGNSATLVFVSDISGRYAGFVTTYYTVSGNGDTEANGNGDTEANGNDYFCVNIEI